MTNKRQAFGTAFVLGLLVPAYASAQDATPPTEAAPTGAASNPAPPAQETPTAELSKGALYEQGGLAGIGLVVGGKLGGGFSTSQLGGSFVGELELGYDLPVLDRSIEAFVSGQYIGPTTSGSGLQDSRLPTPAKYEVTEQQAIVTLGGYYRLHLPTPLFRPYGGLGARLYMLKTKVTGSAGTAFGENQETATKLGIFAALGGELHVGPGAVLLELQTGYAGIDGFVLRDTSTGGLNIALGYRIFI